VTAAIEPQVRPANGDDLGFLVEATEIGRAAVVGTRGGDVELLLTAPETTLGDRYRAGLADESQMIAIGVVNDVAVGFARAEVRTSPAGESICHIHELFVLPDARGVGVGARLLDGVMAFARTSGCMGVDARALPGDRNTKNFFESFGLVARSLAVHTSLD